MIFLRQKIKRVTPVSFMRGFTLIELMVSLSIFAIVMTISVGTLLILIDVNAKAQALYSSTTNLAYALDSITREIRTGYRYNCQISSGALGETLPTSPPVPPVNDCDSSAAGDFITFTREKDSVRIGYRRNEVTEGGETRGNIEQKISGGNWVPITSSDVNVETFSIVVENSDTYTSGPDMVQPVVTLHIRGTVSNGLDSVTEFNIQSRIVQRRFDVI